MKQLLRCIVVASLLVSLLGFRFWEEDERIDLTPVDIRDLITEEVRELSIEALREQGELIVLTRNAPTIYYEGREGLEGPEYERVVSFAEHLGVSPRFEVLDSVSAVLDGIRAGAGHMAAAALTRTHAREQEFQFGPVYKVVREQVVCHRDDPSPKRPVDLVGRDVAVVKASSYEETLFRISVNLPELDWTSVDDKDTEELLEEVAARAIDCTVADSNIVDINRRYLPQLAVAFSITDEEPLAWIVAPRARALLPEMAQWFEGFQSSGRMGEIEAKYYGYVAEFDYVDLSTFIERIDERLTIYRRLFEDAARAHDLPWTLLAAVGYQESHWDPKARSPTGVRGLMMLTLAASKEVGVKNRLDPKQSVDGGALYLRRMIDRMPESLTGDDRRFAAMAAYNVGLGHLYDARTLARRLGKDPDLWRDLRTVLPLLARKKFYRTLKHGYARGGEPVRYVQRIRNYRDILEDYLERNEGEEVATR